MKMALSLSMVLSTLFFSLSTFAGGLKPHQAYLEEIQDQVIGGDEVSHNTKMDTELTVSSETRSMIRLIATKATRWQSGSQFFDVKGVVLDLNSGNQNANVVVYQTDGNSMGSIQTQLKMACDNGADLIMCQTILTNGDKLYLAIGR